MLIVQPALADIPKTTPAVSDTMSIAYRGNGGYYIGNTIVFDGRDSVGNVTILKITGPGLPSSGVPLYDMNGNINSGNTVDVGSDGSWRFVWYTSNIKGIDQLQTARYTITAMDLAHPDNAVATSIFLKKPDFSVIAHPDVVKTGEYVQLFGNAENGISSVRIDVTDLSGTVLRTYESAVSASGYFNNGFHVDMAPGKYYVVITNPLTKKTSRSVLTVSTPDQTTVSTPVVTPVSQMTVIIPVTPAASQETLAASTSCAPTGSAPSCIPTGSAAPQAPAPAAAFPFMTFAIIGILLVICLVVVLLFLRKKTP
ncbi:hypothetical protein [uncultured Methanoregula sp.]|uniref:hypothetical protein n=1 Tax=uncultured Methanoregula sp. TaxID=1005933 RepID=UPI002AAA83B0|nr:hypothetical protein [uncultured Methanoregula sp.]